MNAVTIHDLRTQPPVGMLAVDLIDILRLAEPSVRASIWTCEGVWVLDDSADELGAISDRHGTIRGEEMFRIAGGVGQIIRWVVLGQACRRRAAVADRAGGR